MSQPFPRAITVAQALALADVLTKASEELRQIADDAPSTEPGTLKRRVRAVGLEVAFQLDGEP